MDLTPEQQELIDKGPGRSGTREGANVASKPEEAPVPGPVQMLLEVRTCALCLGPVVYWEGDFLHLNSACPSAGRS